MTQKNNQPSFELEVLSEILAIARLEQFESIPAWAIKNSFFSISKTSDELSIVCPQDNIPDNVKSEKNWRALKVKGPLDFGLSGVLAALIRPLAEAKISIFSISTFDTDYILVKNEKLQESVRLLTEAGHKIK